MDSPPLLKMSRKQRRRNNLIKYNQIKSFLKKQKLNKKRYKNLKNERCAICLREFSTQASDVGSFDTCPHVFHWGCIKEWTAIGKSCPFCARGTLKKVFFCF